MIGANPKHWGGIRGEERAVVMSGTFNEVPMDQVVVGRPAADVVGAFIAGLGMPRTLGEVDVTRDRFDPIARNSLRDRRRHANPRKIDGAAAVVGILEMAA